MKEEFLSHQREHILEKAVHSEAKSQKKTLGKLEKSEFVVVLQPAVLSRNPVHLYSAKHNYFLINNCKAYNE